MKKLKLTDPHKFQLKPRLKSQIRRKILRWYELEKRDLPWRQTRDPYTIWVSEIMLQQTQVDTVIPYYQRWLKQFPTVKKLATAKEEKVLKAWEGLGYYSRARNLHKAANMIVEQFGGVVPGNPEQLSKLPGIGPYTLGAVMSIAFDRPVPAVDGNVLRVFSRLFAFKENIKEKETVERIQNTVSELFQKTKRSEMTQAWMELGALICLPAVPKCGKCPLNTECEAKKKNLTDRLPIVSKRPKIKKVETAAMILQKNGNLLLEKKPLGQVMGGLWTFPTVELKNKEAEIPALFREKFGHQIKLTDKSATFSHSYTVHRAKLDVYHAELLKEGKSSAELRWVSTSRIKETPLPAVHAKIANLVLGQN